MIAEREDGFLIEDTKSGLTLTTFEGNLLFTKNRPLLEQTLLELQINRQISLHENNFVLIKAWDEHPFFLYCSLCTEIDYHIENQSIDEIYASEELKKDNLLHVFSFDRDGPATQHIKFFSSLKIALEGRGVNLELASFTFSEIVQGKSKAGREERDKLANLITTDFNLGSPSQRSSFAIVHDQEAGLLLAWAVAFSGINIHEILIGTLFWMDCGTIGSHPQKDKLFDGIFAGYIDPQDPGDGILMSEQDRVAHYNRMKTVIENVQKYLTLSDQRPTELSFDESIRHEYKASFSVPYPEFPVGQNNHNGQLEFKLGNKTFQSQKAVRRFIEEQSLKTLVAFMNTRGGTLVIGVAEKGRTNKIVGIEREGFESADEYERHIIQQITNRIGVKFLSKHITIDFVKSEDLQLCIIRCLEFKPSQTETPVYLDGRRTFRRTGARTDEIETLKEMSEFTIERIS